MNVGGDSGSGIREGDGDGDGDGDRGGLAIGQRTFNARSGWRRVSGEAPCLCGCGASSAHFLSLWTLFVWMWGVIRLFFIQCAPYPE